MAIVIDDCGQRLDLLESATTSKLPLTFAVLPHLPHSRESATVAHAKGFEVIVHQPMQPESGAEDPGEGAIATGMKRARIEAILRDSFADVPHARGLNNHMGSKATSDRALMEVTMAALHALKPDACFLDSRTTAQTVAYEVARSKGVRAAERAVFLDDDLASAAIRGQLESLARIAATRGQAVAIGHLKPETLAVLEEEMPRMAGSSCRFVFLSELVR